MDSDWICYNEDMMLIRRQPTSTLLLALVALTIIQACRRAEDRADDEINPKSEKPAARQSVFVFPEELHVADKAVNEFLREAMTISTSGDYNAFRLLWSAREEPMPRDEFEHGWSAVQEIRIRAFEKAHLAAGPSSNGDDPEAVYAFYAEVRLDPTHLVGQRKPERQIILMLVREHDQWRLARAPQSMRTWLKEKVADPSVPSSTAVQQPEHP